MLNPRRPPHDGRRTTAEEAADALRPLGGHWGWAVHWGERRWVSQEVMKGLKVRLMAGLMAAVVKEGVGGKGLFFLAPGHLRWESSSPRPDPA